MSKIEQIESFKRFRKLREYYIIILNPAIKTSSKLIPSNLAHSLEECDIFKF